MSKPGTVVTRLSDREIRRYMASPGVAQLKDPRRSLYVRYAQDRQTASFTLVVYAKGKTIRRCVGKFPAITTAEMLKALPAIHSQIRVEHDRARVRPAEFETVAALLSWYRERSQKDRNLSMQRKRTLKSAINRQLLPLVGGFDVAELTRSVIDAELIWPLQSGYSVAYVRLILGVFKQACKQAVRLSKLPFDPLAGVVLSDFVKAKVKAKPLAVEMSELPQVAAQVGAANHQGYLLALLMLSCGTRGGETRLARWVEMDWSNGVWNIPTQHTKTREGYAVPLTGLLRQALQAYRHDQRQSGYDGAFIFPNGQGQPISAVTAWTLIKEVSGGQWTGHDLRKLARSMWIKLRVDYSVCELLLNHKFSKLDQVYIHERAEDQKRDALKLWHDTLAPWGVFGPIAQDMPVIRPEKDVFE